MRAVLFAPALLAAGVTACGPSTPPQAPGSSADAAAAEPAATSSIAADNAPLQAALRAQHWQLQQASDAHGTSLGSLFVAGTPPLQLDFSDHRIQVSQTCNALGADYSVAQAHLQIGRVVSSKRLCAQPRRMAQERAASELLSGRFAVALNTAQTSPQLTLIRSDGTRLVFGGVATADTRYGGPGQTLLIEVAADSVACGSDPARQCLQLREQDAAGQPVTQTWQVLESKIEGFEHEAGIRTLLRVTRYPAAAGTDGAPVYVLEQMIEASG